MIDLDIPLLDVPMCEYFTADSTLGEGGVSSDGHSASEGLYFFVGLSNGDAVRVKVCKYHANILKEVSHD